MFDQLSERLQSAFSAIQGNNQLTQDNMNDALREVRRALIEADVSLKVIKAFISRIKDRADGEAVLKQVEPGEQLIKIVHDELVLLLGKENTGLNLETSAEKEASPEKPALIMMFGLQGSGKTTTSGKLALSLKNQGKRPLLVAADVYRPAAIQQLMTLGKQTDIPVHACAPEETDVSRIVATGLTVARQNNHDVVIIDTAGRLQVDSSMMAELLLLERQFSPQEKLLVIDAMTGQESVAVAETFNSQLDVTGIVLTKLDGDSRGGAAISVVEATGKPIKLIATGEKLDALEPFYPDRLANRILGMGDVVSLVERAQAAFDEEESRRVEAKIRKNDFSLNDFKSMMKSFKLLGPLDQLLGMLPIPGLTKEMRESMSQLGDGQFKKIDIIINSMTLVERDKPDIINASRQKRIAKGCGISEKEIAQFLKQFTQMRMMMKQMTQMKDMFSGGSPALDQSEAAEIKDGAEPASGKTGLSMGRKKQKGKKKQPSPEALMKEMRAFGNQAGSLPKKPGKKGIGLPPGFPKLPPF
ncbi:MAG: signal recognition particle protein [Cyanobacteria bacterium P01_H01_bin.74]